MITTRKAGIADSESLARLSNLLGYETSEETLKTRFRMLRARDQEVYVAEIDQIIVGYISFEPYLTLYLEPGLNITALVVVESCQKRGVGKELVRIAEAYAKENDLKYLRANSSSVRTEAHKFYRTVGFDGEKDQKRFIKEVK